MKNDKVECTIELWGNRSYKLARVTVEALNTKTIFEQRQKRREKQANVQEKTNAKGLICIFYLDVGDSCNQVSENLDA